MRPITLASNEQCLPPPPAVSSDSVHCNALTQASPVSYAFSCHTTDSCFKDNADVDSSLGLPSSSTTVKEDVTSSTALSQGTPLPQQPLWVNPSWVHVFSKSCSTTSLCTQSAAVAYLDLKSPKVLHRRARCAKKKDFKIQEILREVIVPQGQVTLSCNEIDSKIIVFDGSNVPSNHIRPPHGIMWRCLPVRTLHVEDETRPNFGLTFPKLDGVYPFIQLPRQMSLGIIDKFGLDKVNRALSVCEMLRRTALCCGDASRVFSDYGKTVTYACVGPQPSRNSKTVRTHTPFTLALPDEHWRTPVWMMKRAERSFSVIAQHSVLSHLQLAKKLVPFKTFTANRDKYPSAFNAQFFGGIAFGTNVFLRCHTDADFTMSIIQVFLKGKSVYLSNDDVVVYFCFPTIGVAVPLCPGDYLLFNACIPHCISSRCKVKEDIIVTSIYLKTAVVGMNNNDIPLTAEQTRILERFQLNNKYN